MSVTFTKPANLEEAIQTLRTQFQGDILEPSDPSYDEARALWNGMIDKYPAVIAKCAGTDDVVQAVNLARDSKLKLAVRGGGHNVAGLASADGGIVIDLSEMRRVEVDPVNKRANVQGGAEIGAMDRETQHYGLAVPMGVFSETGVAGLTLGGGMGWLRRKYGLSCDNLIAAEVVTAEGKVVRASEDENPDLLWGLRGGGGNFGIVTQFEFQLYEVGPEVAFTFVLYPLSETKKVLRAHEAFLKADTEGNVSTIALTGRVPHLDDFPKELHGVPMVGIFGMHAGKAEEGLEVMKPLREIAEPLIDLSGPMTYAEAQQVFDPDYPDGLRYYWKSTSLMSLSDEVIDILVEHSKRAPSDHSTVDVWYHGGAYSYKNEEDTAFGRRDIPYLVNPEANWEDPEDDEANIAWARNLLTALEPHAEANLYLNFPGFLEEGDALMQKAFGRNYAQLVELKTKYDPANLLSMNQNIKPKGDKR